MNRTQEKELNAVLAAANEAAREQAEFQRLADEAAKRYQDAHYTALGLEFDFARRAAEREAHDSRARKVAARF